MSISYAAYSRTAEHEIRGPKTDAKLCTSLLANLPLDQVEVSHDSVERSRGHLKEEYAESVEVLRAA